MKKQIKTFSVILVMIFAFTACAHTDVKTVQKKPNYNASEIFPLVNEHVHGSTIVELPNGDLLAAWFQGSGERWADDVRIMGAHPRVS